MRQFATFTVLLLAAAAPAPAAAPANASHDEETLMEEIERAVVLPKGAKPLNAYGRNYALSGPNLVVATYLIPSPPIDFAEGCEVMVKDFKSRPCTKKEIEESARSDATNVAAQTPAGERRWYKSARSLPFISDGGCTQVNVEYDLVTHRVTAVACNGYA